MMQKIKIEIEELNTTIEKFYDPKEWHFLTLNGVALDAEHLELQWIFSRYEALDQIVIYYAEVSYDTLIPSVADLIPSAIISQRELVDMFGVNVAGSEKGLYLDEDSMQKPLAGCSL